MSRFSQKFLLPIMMILSVTLHLSPFSIQAMESSKQYDEQHGTTLSPLLQVFLTFDWNDQFKNILGHLDGGDVNSLLLAYGKHDDLFPLRKIIKEVLGEKCMGWFIHDLDSDELSPYSYAPYIARSFYFRLIDLINASNFSPNEQPESIHKTRQSLQEFLKGIPSLQNHSASYLLKHWGDDEGADTLTDTDLANQGVQSASEIFLLLYTFAKRTPLIPDLDSDPYAESRILGIKIHASLIPNHALKEAVLSFLDATQSISLGEWFILHRTNNDHSYLEQYQSLHDARECFYHAQSLIDDKIRNTDEIRSNFLREIFGPDASVFENRTASVVFLTRGSEAQKITLHMVQKSKKKLDVISEGFLMFAKLNQHIGEAYIKEAQLLAKQGFLDTALETHKQALFYFLQPEPKLNQEEISDQNRLNCFRISNHRSTYRCLKVGANLYLRSHKNTKALNNLKLARKIFSPWVDEGDPLVNISEKLTGLQNRGICYSKEGAIYQHIENDEKALTSYRKARNLFHQVIIAGPGLNAANVEYHLGNCHKSEGAIYYKQDRLSDAASSYGQAQIYFTEALRNRLIFRHWKAQYGLASCLIKQVGIRRLLGIECDTQDSRNIEEALMLLKPILNLVDHPELRKKAEKTFNVCIMESEGRNIDLWEVLRNGEG